MSGKPCLASPEIQGAKRLYNVDMVFMQDNAPCHKTKLIIDFFNRKHIQTLDWPAQSPDLNPIENLWAYIKKKRTKKFGPPKSKAQLIEQVMSIWDEFDQELIQNLAKSISNRLKEVSKVKGNYTSY